MIDSLSPTIGDQTGPKTAPPPPAEPPANAATPSTVEKTLPTTKADAPLSSGGSTKVELNVLPPLSQLAGETPPPAPANLQAAPGSTPSVAPPVPETTASASSDAPPPYTGGANTSQVSKGKLVLYFCLGLFLNFLSFLPVVLFLALKNKVGTKQKFIAYLIGIGAAMLLGITLETVLRPVLMQFVGETFPPLAYMPPLLQQSFPGTEFGANVYYETSVEAGESQKHGSITISVLNNPNLTSEDVKQIGVLTCQLTAERGDYFDQVAVSQVRQQKIFILTMDYSQTVSQTCDEWFRQPAPTFPELPNGQ